MPEKATQKPLPKPYANPQSVHAVVKLDESRERLFRQPLIVDASPLESNPPEKRRKAGQDDEADKLVDSRPE